MLELLLILIIIAVFFGNGHYNWIAVPNIIGLLVLILVIFLVLRLVGIA